MPSETLGVVIVTFNSSDVVIDCLESLVAAADADGVRLDIAVVDNASSDGTPAQVRAWGAGGAYTPPGDLPFAWVPALRPLQEHRLSVLSPGVNGGFAAGVNIGLRHLMQQSGTDRVWVLNPDSLVPPGTPGAFARYSGPAFALMGGRLVYAHAPHRVQLDGGTVQRWSGATRNVNRLADPAQVPAPQASALDFITGASMIVSRAFWETVGPMTEDYFLYYEEVDWALRRGDLPLAVCPQAVVYHQGGTSIGSGVQGQGSTGFSLFFKHRARMMFVRRHLPGSVLSAWGFTLAKAAQHLLKRDAGGAVAILRGALDIAPPRSVLERLSPEAASLALSPSGLAAYRRARPSVS